jgi:hypothetical protein
MDSNIWVAVITGRPKRFALLISFFLNGSQGAQHQLNAAVFVFQFLGDFHPTLL